MCFAIPGKVVEIRGNEIMVDYSGQIRKAKSFFDVNLDDYVIVNNKIIIEIIPKEDAIKFFELINKNEK